MQRLWRPQARRATAAPYRARGSTATACRPARAAATAPWLHRRRAACGSTATTCGPARACPSAAPVAPPPLHRWPSRPVPRRLNIPESAMEGTVVFSGLRAAPRIEAKISEKKPDGTFGKTVPITKETLIGRENCDLSYPQDTLLSPRHASVAVREGKLVLKDLNSQNGSFIRQRQDTELTPGDVFLLGRELFRFVTQSLDESLNKAVGWGHGDVDRPQAAKGTAHRQA